MVTNLPEKAKALWAKAQAEKDLEKKLSLLKQFYSSFPKHKGTEKLQVSIKRQIANLEEELERRKIQRKKLGTQKLEWVIKKEGQIQLALVGKLDEALELFNNLVGKKFEVHQVLSRPLVGNFKNKDLNFQLVLSIYDPELSYEKNQRFLNLSKNSDLLLILVNDEDYLKKVIEWYEEHNLDITSKPIVELSLTSSGGIRIVGSSFNFSEKDLRDFLESYGIKNAVISLSKDATLEDVEAVIYGREMKRVIFLTSREEFLDKLKGDALNIKDLDLLNEKILDKLNLIRIYTKGIGKEVSQKPLLVKKDSSILEVAREIHKDLADNFKFAKVWRKNLLIKVGANFKVQDMDIIEIHA